nr:MAG: hypothetical protein 1 [Leviviridae sp.]
MGNKTFYEIKQDKIDVRNTLGCNSSSINNNPTITSQYQSLKFSRTGVDNPKWRDQVKRGDCASTPLGVAVDTMYFDRGYVDFKGITSYNRGLIGRNEDEFTDRPSGWIPDTFNFNTLEAEATSKAAIGFRQKIRQEQQAFSGMTFLAELRESIAMLRRPAAALRNALNAYTTQNLVNYKKLTGLGGTKLSKRQRISAKKTFAQALSGSWLEFSFGAQPLIADISVIAESALRLCKERRIKRISYTAQSSTSTHNSSYSTVAGLPWLIYYDDYHVFESSVRFLGGYLIDVEMTESSLQRVVNDAGFNLTDVIPTAWELVPWSFLIDYFTNIGDVLSATYVSLDNLKWSQKTVRNSCTRYVITKRPASSSCLEVIGHKPSILKSQRLLISRSAADIPIPEFRFELPGRNIQFLNMSALAVQASLKLFK